MPTPGCPITKLQFAALSLMKTPVYMEFCNKCNACKCFILRAPEFAHISDAAEIKKYVKDNNAKLVGLILDDIEQCNIMPIHMLLYFNMGVFRYDYRLMSDYRFSDISAGTITICVALTKIAIEEKLSFDPIKDFAEKRNGYIGALRESYPSFQFPHDHAQTVTPLQIRKYGAYFNMSALTNIMVVVGVRQISAAAAWLEYNGI